MAEVAAAHGPTALRCTLRRKGAVLALLAFAMLVVSLDQYIVVVALPEIDRDLGFSTRRFRRW